MLTPGPRACGEDVRKISSANSKAASAWSSVISAWIATVAGARPVREKSTKFYRASWPRGRHAAQLG